VTGANSHGAEPAPLAGTTVLDFTRILSGPFATMLLADLGADVIKVERPGSGDDSRSWGPPFVGGTSSYFQAINRGKRSVVIDLRSEGGRDLVHELAAEADVLVENFRPGVTQRLGISYEDLEAVNPRLVYASINGFGATGPKAGEAGTEVIVEAETGLMAMMGVAGGPPVRFGVAMIDIATGIAAVAGILGALLQRASTGRGRNMQFPLYATAFSCLGTVISSASVDPSSQGGRWGSGHPSIVPYSAFETSDGYVVLGAINEEMWTRLVDALDLFDLADDPRAMTNHRRVANREFVEGRVSDALRTLPREEVTRRLTEHGVLVAPVKPAIEAIKDPQVDVLDLIYEEAGVAFAQTPLAHFNPERLAPAPMLGEHTLEILREKLGLPEKELDRLVSEQSIASTDADATVADGLASLHSESSIPAVGSPAEPGGSSG
jgi:crotonobetainyl-CoA:carnitine CoA-transferase CaiB-like acyl-CoA transferase